MENTLLQSVPSQKTSTADNVQKIALPFFILIGMVHFGAALLANSPGASSIWESLPKITLIIARVTDLPFLLTALTYTLATIKKAVNNLGLSSRLFDRFIISVGVLIFAAVTVINLIYPDQPLV